MKKKIKKAEDGQRIRGKSTSYPEGVASGVKSMMNPRKLTTAPAGLNRKFNDDKSYNENIVRAKKEASTIGKTQWNTEYLGPSGKDYAKDAISDLGSAPRVGPVKRKSDQSASAPKGSASSGGSKGGGSSAPKSGTKSSTKTETKSAPKPGIRMSTSKLPVSAKQLERSKPVDVSYKRTYSDTEKKMQEIMAKGKKADGTMSESAQAKIKALRDKERMAGQKAERQQNRSNRRAIAKSVRAGKFNKRVIAKSAK